MATDSKTTWRVANYKILIYTHPRVLWHLRLAENRRHVPPGFQTGFLW
jgi:hypothetical protein